LFLLPQASSERRGSGRRRREKGRKAKQQLAIKEDTMQEKGSKLKLSGGLPRRRERKRIAGPNAKGVWSVTGEAEAEEWNQHTVLLL
jgi:hypothetical protein